MCRYDPVGSEGSGEILKDYKYLKVWQKSIEFGLETKIEPFEKYSISLSFRHYLVNCRKNHSLYHR